MHLAAENNHADVVKIYVKYMPQLVSLASKNGMTCAHIAARNGAVAVIKELLAFRRNFVTATRNKITEALPIHLAVSGGHKEVVRVLITAGSHATAENAEGMTAIHLAAKEGNVEVLQSIPSKVSLQQFSRKNGLAPIHVAAFYGNTEVIRELQTRGDINLRTQVAQKSSAVLDLMLRNLVAMDVSFLSNAL